MPTTYTINATNPVQYQGVSGSVTSYNFTVSRSGDLLAESVPWSVTNAVNVIGADFIGGFLPTGAVNFNAGQTSGTLRVDVAGGPHFSADGTFLVALGRQNPISTGTLGSNSGGFGVTRDNYVISADGGTLRFNYEMFSIPDRGDVLKNGVSILTTGGAVSGAATLTYAQTGANALKAGDKITVILSGYDPSTAWNYTVSYTGGLGEQPTAQATILTAPQTTAWTTVTGSNGDWLTSSKPYILTATDGWAIQGFNGFNSTYLSADARYYVGVVRDTLIDTATDLGVTQLSNRIAAESPDLANIFDGGTKALGLYSTLKQFIHDSFDLISDGADSVLGKGSMTPEEYDARATQIATDLQINLLTSLIDNPISNLVKGVARILNHSDLTFRLHLGADAINGAIDHQYTMLGGDRADIFNGANQNDLLWGGPGNDTMKGNAGDDYLVGGTGSDSLTGGPGNDAYIVESQSDSVIEAFNEGTDRVMSSGSYSLTANVETLLLTGGAASSGTGNSLDNLIIGNGNANTLDGGFGADTLIGGAGDDTYVVDNVSDVIAEAIGAGTDTEQASVSIGLGPNVENLILSGFSSINGTGNELNNLIMGNSAANTLNGLGGTDTLRGGAGDDTYVIDEAVDVVDEVANNGAGTDIVQASITYALPASVETLFLMGGAAINGTGNTTANTLVGNANVNVLDGGAGNDSLFGGAGDDTYIIDSQSDVIGEAAGGGIDTVVSSVTVGLGANLENLILSGGAAINGGGNADNNTLTGNNNVNTLSGAGGNDTYVLQNFGDFVAENVNEGTDTVQTAVTLAGALYNNVENLTLTGGSGINGVGNTLGNIITGNSGNNVLVGMAGDDVYIVQNAGDSVVENANEGNDLVFTSATFVLGNNVEILSFAEAGAINGTGNAGANNLYGNSSDNVLSGQGGNDLLVANAGNDTLFGGDGVDTLSGDAGNDVLSGGAGNDTLSGGTGDDVIVGGGTNPDPKLDNAAFLGGSLGADWTATGIMDTTGDGRGDILWTKAGGLSAVWTVNGFSVGSGSDIVRTSTGAPSALGADWTAAAFDDFNGDGKGDALWSRSSTGQAVIVQLDGTVITAAALLGGAIGANWAVKGTGDFDGDGKADILWSRDNGGGNGTSVAIWYMNGLAIKNSNVNFGQNNGAIGLNGTNQQIAGVGDLNGDGRDDIIWRNTSTGDHSLWTVNSTTSISAAALSPTKPTGTNWTLKGVEDFNGDGKDDLLWHNGTSNAVEAWMMQGASRNSTVAMPSIGSDWKLAGLSDGTGDGVADIYWTKGGQVVIWEVGANSEDVMTGGSGRDTFHFESRFDAGNLVSDFQAGAGGDVLGMSAVMSGLGMAGTNGLSAGVVRAFQNGTATEVQVDTRPGAGTHWISLATLQNTTAAALTADNWSF